MVKSCSAFKCRNRYRKGLKFHQFPKDLNLRKKWVIALRRKDFVPSESAKICEEHFAEEDYYLNAYGKKVLNKCAVPSIFNFPKHLQKQIKPRRVIKKIISTDSKTSSAPVEVQRSDSSTPSTSPCYLIELDTDVQRHSIDNISEESTTSVPVEVQESNFPTPSTSPCYLIEIKETDVQRHSTENVIFEDIESIIRNLESNGLSPTPTASYDRVDDIHLQKENEVETPVKKHSRRERFSYFGDFQEEDLESPKNRHLYWVITQNIITSLRHKNRYLQCQVNRKNKRIVNLMSLIEDLKK